MEHIVLFDGECNFCNRAIQFILKHEGDHLCHFASLQSKIGQDLLKDYGIKEDTDSFIYICHQKAYLESTAALMLTKRLRGIWRLGQVFLLVPKFLRDKLYRIIAKNRHKIIKNDKCILLNKAQAQRFLS